ncbi:MAG TPA: UvrD-helicase domain-containing protein [Polyangiaceae bacterium]|nr:UvrD-helicase domain-containing protein [Polyangiaceae bacterium]
MTAAELPPGARGLRLVGASAGTGKTFCLTTHVSAALESRQVDPEALVAVTFTTKAQAELEARLRQRLLQGGAPETAAALPLAYMGTIHGVCLRLLKEFALEGGLAPSLDVIPAHESRRLLQATLERELPPDLWERLQRLGRSLEIENDPRMGRFDVVKPIDDIMALARSNRITPDLLPAMALRSWDALSRQLPPAAPDAAALEAELAAALGAAIPALIALDDGQKNTRDACAFLQEAARDLARALLPWSQWAKLAKVQPGKRGLPLVEPVREAAAAHVGHPRLRAEVRDFIYCVFEAAQIALTKYAEWKSRRGLVDFVDMVDGALSLLGQDDVTRDLSERLGLIVVDEFQDTSPIQLELFMRLHALVGSSIWVGDRKQCIFEYAGADPELMDAVARWAADHGGHTEQLQTSYRSRPELVHLCSRVFAGAFPRQGIGAAEVVTVPHRASLDALSDLPPLGVWWLDGHELGALAAGLAALLAEPSRTPVLDRQTGLVRPLVAGDVAVLVYTNADAERLGEALAARGIDSVLARVGLLTTPEGSMLRAALGWLIDGRDDLAAAELAALTGFDGQTHEQWLSQRLHFVAERSRQQAQREQQTADGSTQPEPSPFPDAPLCAACARLEALRPQLTRLSPSEAVDRVLAVLDLASWAERWPDPAQRVSNLEALRALASAYEERCSYQREAASIAGLLRYFDETREKLRQRDEERATDEQHVRGGDAIVISTYHKAKGLEWPVVVLAGLDRAPQRDAFDVALETEGQPFDPEHPLAGRWIRYWPWPLGAQRKTALRERAESSEIGRRVAERERRERVRLLYVGWTRARDHLVLAIPRKANGTPRMDWLNELADDQGPLLSLPDPDADVPELGVRTPEGEHRVPVRCQSFGAPDHDPEPVQEDAPRCTFAAVEGRPSPIDYRLTPSRAATELDHLGEARLLRTERLKRRMAFTAPRGISWDAIGTTLHAFLAADIEALSDEERRSLAERVLTRGGLRDTFTSDALLDASDALRDFVARRWPGAIWHREIPIRARFDSDHGARAIEGCIDLLLETPGGVILVDHKSFPGRASEWEQRALAYAPQLLAYARALEIAGKSLTAMLVHFTVGGGVVEMEKVATTANIALGERR